MTLSTTTRPEILGTTASSQQFFLGRHMTGNDFFALWQAFRVQDKCRKPMGEPGLKQADMIWRMWLLYCAEKHLDWMTALPDDVDDFVTHIEPKTDRAQRKLSHVTMRRYWRILNDLYAHAVLERILEKNPAKGVMPEQNENVNSLALTPNMWQQLHDGLPSGHVFKDRRNKLVLLLAMRCALTTSEILALKIESVKPHGGTPEQISERLALAGMPLFQPESPQWIALEPHPIFELQLQNARELDKRSLILDRRTSKALHDWLEVRLLTRPATDHKLVLGETTGGGLTAKGLYNICHRHFVQCIPDAERILHLGPNTLRNTCISVWRNQGVPDAEILRRCGLTDAGALRRLQIHFNPRIALS